ncbi:MAG: DUF3313 family protein [Steroidobacteraceae bacterium]|nr:DUF3313 family protein [Steroidobacteraceae bacterium]
MNASSRVCAIILTAMSLLVSGSIGAAEEAETWDGLTRMKAKHMDAVFLLPGADFTGYTAVIIEPVEVALKENWQRDVNRSRMGTRRVTDEQVQKMRTEVAEALPEVFARDFEKAGWTIATEPAPHVLSLQSAVINIDVAAPDTPSAGRVKSYSFDAGSATLALEVRDSQTHQLLGRAVDARRTPGGSASLQWTTSVSNRADFQALFRDWSRILVNGMNELKEGAEPEPQTGK